MEKLEKGPWEINWERFRKWGVIKFSLVFGTILGPLTYLLGLFTHLIDASFAEVFLDGNLLKNVLVSCIVGILGPGIFTWYLNEYWYKKALAHIQTHNEEVERNSAQKTSLESLSTNELSLEDTPKETLKIRK